MSSPRGQSFMRPPEEEKLPSFVNARFSIEIQDGNTSSVRFKLDASENLGGSRESAPLEVVMSKQPCIRDTEDRLDEISVKGDPLETQWISSGSGQSCEFLVEVVPRSPVSPARVGGCLDPPGRLTTDADGPSSALRFWGMGKRCGRRGNGIGLCSSSGSKGGFLSRPASSGSICRPLHLQDTCDHLFGPYGHQGAYGHRSSIKFSMCSIRPPSNEQAERSKPNSALISDRKAPVSDRTTTISK